ncbi:BMP family ABC transporter substrate-binding protein [Leptolyngbya sp. 'hensonii']|uniref:BMP family ABC transporter substrate-binding protein n=1 Tax=Leptolyngbya sp. 'hensonii' TaxID=1922337 RepID=UPI00094F4FF8|nr:BMP family ABC transporter substrate-binding protein [Leptolyngbya sp. 'hensonii']OLP16696.1 BMP family ABC transporter substrate-binding protein [Leptolyngbya sp. 'hensonii']
MDRQHPPLILPRRQILRGLLGTTAFGVTSRLWTGCTPSSETGSPNSSTTSPSTTASSSPKTLALGFIYVGSKDDYGYNQAHAEGKTGLSKLPDVKTLEEASVPETTAVQETMRNMISQDGATALFPTSFGYFDPHILILAKEFPEVQFFHCGGLYQEGKTPSNVGSYFGYIDEAQYIAGIVAAHTSKSGKLGFIAAKPIAQVLRNINSYTLGARSINPKVSTNVIFTGDWSQPVKEAEAANSLADQGVDVLTCHVDSPKIIMETAEKRGIFCTGYHANQANLAPKGYLTGAEWDWANIYTQYAKDLLAGKTLMNNGIAHLVRGGLKEGFCKLSPYGAAVTAAAKTDADAAQAKFMNGSMVIYKGELKDNSGKVVIPAGKELTQQDIELEKMNWLVEGVIGSLS